QGAAHRGQNLVGVIAVLNVVGAYDGVERGLSKLRYLVGKRLRIADDVFISRRHGLRGLAIVADVNPNVVDVRPQGLDEFRRARTAADVEQPDRPWQLRHESPLAVGWRQQMHSTSRGSKAWQAATGRQQGSRGMTHRGSIDNWRC